MSGERCRRDALRRMRPGLGTFVEIGCERGPAADDAVEQAYGVIADIGARLGFHDPDSELSRLNRAGGAAVELSPVALCVLRLALALGRASAGRFDCTLGGALVRRGVLPDHGFGTIRAAGGLAAVAVDGRTVRLRRGVLLTLDGIAKGYAVDAAVATLRRRGVAWGWVNAGGDLRAFGDVVVPVYRREGNGELRRLGGLSEAALASSNGPDRGESAAPGLILGAGGVAVPAGSWSVVARRAWRADALTKVAALTPPQLRAAELARLGGRLVAVTESRA